MLDSQDGIIAPARRVADKSRRGALSRAIRMALEIESSAVRRNTQTFNQNRYRAVGEIADYEQLKARARAIKEFAIADLKNLLEQVRKAVESRGGHFYLAETGEEACEYVKSLCVRHHARLVVKAKSMTSEEIGLNRVLEQAGLEVAETDLAEFILQYSGEQPSHIVAPAIHLSRERISALFKQKFATDHPLDTGEDLTRFARDILRKKFLAADIGITGANVIAADTGTLVLVESEGNIRMVTQAPPVHIAIAGVEKVIPSREELAVFIELLAPSGTGQPLTCYTHVISPPLNLPSFSFRGKQKKEREFYLVLVDNGRMRMRADPVLREALYCIRCSACLNVCANFQTVGGHAFGGETYSGGIGAAWEAGTGQVQKARFAELCTGCSRCVPQCPVRIDIPWLNAVLRERLNQKASWREIIQKQFFADYARLAALISRVPAVITRLGEWPFTRWLLEKSFGFDRRREVPGFSPNQIKQEYSVWIKKGISPKFNDRAVLFADVFTHSANSAVGRDVLRLFRYLGIEMGVSDVMAEGRAALSQGLIRMARNRAKKTAAYLSRLIDQGFEVVVPEPSVLALFRQDYRNLLANEPLFTKIKSHVHDPVEYLVKILRENKLHPTDLFQVDKLENKKIFYHGHCQQKNIGAFEPTLNLLRRLTFDVAVSSAECCGMAGSFGYKRQFYDLSRKVGEDLVAQIRKLEAQEGERLVLVNGVSCKEQLRSFFHRELLHPVQLLTRIMIP